MKAPLVESVRGKGTYGDFEREIERSRPKGPGSAARFTPYR